MATAKNGDTVSVHYTGTLEDGSVFDSSIDREPLKFKVGEGQLIPGFEEAVIGMDIGETKDINLSSDEAYGPHQNEMVISLNKSQIPKDSKLEIGLQVQLNTPDGNMLFAKIIDIKEDRVVLDANHPLAGKNLNFNIKLVRIN